MNETDTKANNVAAANPCPLNCSACRDLHEENAELKKLLMHIYSCVSFVYYRRSQVNLDEELMDIMRQTNKFAS